MMAILKKETPYIKKKDDESYVQQMSYGPGGFAWRSESCFYRACICRNEVSYLCHMYKY